MQWPLGLASLLWVWQFPHYHLSLSFSRALFLHFGWPSRISLLQSMVQHELLILLDLFSGVCTVQRVAYWVYYASPFFLLAFSHSCTDGSIFRMEVLLRSLVCVRSFSQHFFLMHQLSFLSNCLLLVFWLGNTHFNLFIIGCSSFVIRCCGPTCCIYILGSLAWLRIWSCFLQNPFYILLQPSLVDLQATKLLSDTS